jgi:hypothetical protein
MAFEELQNSLIELCAGKALISGAEKITGIEEVKKIEQMEGALWLCHGRLVNNRLEYNQITPLLNSFRIGFDCPNIKVEKLIISLRQFKSKVKNYPGLEKDLKERVATNIGPVITALIQLEKELELKTKKELIQITLDPNMYRIIAGIAIGATAATYIISNN